MSEQDDAPILEAIQKYLDEQITPFSIPGHKTGKSIDALTAKTLGYTPYQHDVLELSGFDDRSESHSYRKKAEALTAKAYKADESYFSTNGSTMSAQVAMMAIGGPGEKVLVARNSHKSVIGGIILSGTHPVFIQPEYEPEWDINHGMHPASLEHALSENPDAVGCIGLSPTYFGVSPDVAALVKIAHAHGIPIVIDEAWGSHFPFSDLMPPSGMSVGADMSFCSMHKTEEGLTQGSVINVKGKLLDALRVQQLLELLRSTSESGLIMASMDANRRQMVRTGKQDLETTVKLAEQLRQKLPQLGPLRTMGAEVLKGGAAAFFDPTKVLVDVTGLGITGFQADDYLRHEHKITVEMSRQNDVLAVVTVGDDDCSISTLIRAFDCLVKTFWPQNTEISPILPKLVELRTDLLMPPRDAFFGKARMIPLEESEGKLVAEMVCPYPPGIPILVPGERITPIIIEYILSAVKHKMMISDVIDESMKTIRIVDGS